MSIDWGSTDTHLRVGIDLSMSPSSVGTDTTSVTVTAKIYVGSVEYGWDDDQSIAISGMGDSNGSVSYHFDADTASNDYQLIKTNSWKVSTSYSSTSSYTVKATVSGAYNGATPTNSVKITVPKRPASPPEAPSTPARDSITGTSIRIDWNAPSDTNGAGIDAYSAQASKTSDFAVGTGSGSISGGPYTFTGLDPGTRYYFRVRAHNSAGWGDYSGTSYSTTLDYPSAPGTPSVSAITPTTATTTSSAPSDNGGASVSNYQIQIATNSAFSSGLVTYTQTSLTKALTGLTPGTTYYLRARAYNSVGWGPWSGTRSFATLSGAKVRSGSTWVAAPCKYRTSSNTWGITIVHKRVGSSWVL